MTHEPLLEQSIDIAAPPARVWELVGDLRRMPEWSPAVTSVRLRQGFDEVALGTELTHRNVHGEMGWTTHSEVIRLEPGHEIAWRVAENWVVWSFVVEPSEGGSRLTQRRETPDGISPASLDLTERHMGGQAEFTRTTTDGMRRTLEAIRDAAESTQTPGHSR